MRNRGLAAALIMLSIPAMAQGAVVAATNAERASGFADRADCEQALGSSDGGQPKAGVVDQADGGGSLFNRAAGNISRCEFVHGEYQIVVYPKGSGA